MPEGSSLMKKVIAIGPILVLALAICIHSQTRSAPPVSTDYIEIFGAKLRLGMTKAEVEEKLSGADIVKPRENAWLVTTGGVSSLQFENGRLSFADRTWHSKDNDIVDALFNAVMYFNNDGHSLCSVSADTVPDPQESYERVWIRCGNKSILVVKGTIQGKTFEEVDEHLGVMKPDSK
jgi:hypothetical protein